jgi:putative ABC transport system permease protein
VKFPFGRKHRNAELNEELRSHLTLAEREEMQSGRARDDARASSHREFGSIALAEEVTRDTWGSRWLADLAQDLSYASRTLRKTPGFTAVAILTVALGIGASTAIFSVVKAVLLNSIPYHDPQQLVTLAESTSKDSHPVTLSYGAVEDWKPRQHDFSTIALFSEWTPTLTGSASPQLILGMRVTRNFFETLGFQPAIGRGFSGEEDHPGRWHVVLLTWQCWVRRFGSNPGVLGQKIILDRIPFEIVGVLPKNFSPTLFLDAGGIPDMWAPLGYDMTVPNACRRCWHLRAVARLLPGVTPARARAEINSVASKLAREFPKDYPADVGVVLTSLSDAWLGKHRAALWLLLASTSFVLLIACANVANLLLARAPAKRREVALRTSLGAAPSRILRQLLTESALLGVLGGAVGLLLGNWLIAIMVRLAPSSLPRMDEVQLDRGMLAFALGLSIVTGIVTGLVPALQLSRVSQREVLQQGSRGTVHGSRSRFRSILIASEVALAFVLTIASLLLLKSFARLMDVNPGFDPRGVYTINFALEGPAYQDNKAVVQFERTALAKIRSAPAVEAAAIVSTMPIGLDFDRNALIREENYNPDVDLPSIDTYDVSPEYFQAMHVPLLRGRLFSDADTQSPAPVVLISEQAARTFWTDADPLGKHVQLNSRDPKQPWATIVGIVGGVRQYGLDTSAPPEIYALYTARPFERPCLIIQSRLDEISLTRIVQSAVWSLDKDVLIWNPFTMTRILHDSVAQRRFTMSLLTSFGVLAVLLAVVGIYGVTSYSVAQRTSEIGLRIALGARRGDVFRMVISQASANALIGVAVGTVVALALARLISGLLFGVANTDALTFISGAVFVAATSLLACCVPARRATKIEPSIALRVD